MLQPNLVDEQKFENDNFIFKTRYYAINDKFAENKQMLDIVEKETGKLFSQLKSAIGYIETDLDCREEMVRTRETNAGNFMCDVIRRAYKCDCVMLIGGSLRANNIIKKGIFTISDILEFVPFTDSIVLLVLKGKDIVDVFENSVSCIHNKDGRFPQIGGAKYVLHTCAYII